MAEINNLRQIREIYGATQEQVRESCDGCQLGSWELYCILC
mgnify:CR=1 FL=1